MSATQQRSELLELTLVDAAAAVARREIASVELVDACLARIGALDDRLRAFIAVHGESARQVAAAAEAMIAAGHRLGPLHGVPIAIKDNIAVAGRRDHGRQQDPRRLRSRTHDATVAGRACRPGAIIVGKTNLHEFAWGGTSANPHYGVRRAIPGTRSASRPGPAAGPARRSPHVRATAPSAPTPAARSGCRRRVNGIVGIRPTIGRVSNVGVIPLAWSMDTVGADDPHGRGLRAHVQRHRRP